MQTRTRVDRGANMFGAQQPGECILSQKKFIGLATIGAGTITAAMVLTGILNRTGPTAGYTDTFPSASSILAASPTLSTGDSFDLIIRNTVAFALTAAAGTGIVLGSNVDIAASLVREYLLTVLSTGTEQILQVTTTNTSAVLTGLTPAQVAGLMPGMGVTGTGIQALTTILGVNSTAGTVTLSLAATATGSVAGTFFPRIQLDGVRSSTL